MMSNIFKLLPLDKVSLWVQWLPPTVIRLGFEMRCRSVGRSCGGGRCHRCCCKELYLIDSDFRSNLFHRDTHLAPSTAQGEILLVRLLLRQLRSSSRSIHCSFQKQKKCFLETQWSKRNPRLYIQSCLQKKDSFSADSDGWRCR